MKNYAPAINPTSLEASSWRFGDDALANEFDTSALINGADPVSSAISASKTPPVIAPTDRTESDVGSTVSKILDFFVTPPKELQQSSNSPNWYNRFSTLIWSVILVIVGIMILSRGFGMLGEEGAEKIALISDPSKYPGIGHAVQSMKKKGA